MFQTPRIFCHNFRVSVSYFHGSDAMDSKSIISDSESGEDFSESSSSSSLLPVKLFTTQTKNGTKATASAIANTPAMTVPNPEE